MASAAGCARSWAREVAQPLRTVIEVGLQKAFFGVMPAFIPDPPALGTKVVSVFPSNTAAGLPTHLATIVLLDPMTGELLSIMDGRFITEARTAAVSAVSVKLLARPRRVAAGHHRLGRAGAQSSRSDWPRARSLRSPSLEPERRTPRRFRARNAAADEAPIMTAASARDAVDGADIVVLATASRDPVVAERMDRGGSARVRGWRVPAGSARDGLRAGRRARVFVDSRAGALAEAGDILIPMAEGAFDETHIAGELGEVASGAVPGRTSPTEVTIFKSLGMAVEDVAAAHLAYVKAAERGLGEDSCCKRRRDLLSFPPLRPPLLHHLGDPLARFGRHLAAPALSAVARGLRIAAAPRPWLALDRLIPARARSFAACAVKAASRSRV